MTTQEQKALELALEGGGLYEITGRIEDIDKCIVHRSVIKEALAVDKESLTTEARHMPSNDALYKAWNLIGADLAGLKFEDFVRHLSAQQNAERVSNEQVEPAFWYRNEDIFGNQEMEPIFYATKAWVNCLPLYTHPPVPTAQPKQEPKKDLMFATVAMQEREDKRIENIVATLEKIKQEQLTEMAQPKEPEQEPDLGGVDVFYPKDEHYKTVVSDVQRLFDDKRQSASDAVQKEIDAYKAANPHCNVVAIVGDLAPYRRRTLGLPDSAPLYTTPPQRKPLTFDEVEGCFPDGGGTNEYGEAVVSAQWLHDFAHTIEAKLKEKNA